MLLAASLLAACGDEEGDTGDSDGTDGSASENASADATSSDSGDGDGDDDTSGDGDGDGDGDGGFELTGTWLAQGVPLNMTVDESLVDKTWTNGAPGESLDILLYSNEGDYMDLQKGGNYYRFFWRFEGEEMFWCESSAYPSQVALQSVPRPADEACPLFGPGDGGAWWRFVAG
jgi:hypothetical protein